MKEKKPTLKPKDIVKLITSQVDIRKNLGKGTKNNLEWKQKNAAEFTECTFEDIYALCLENEIDVSKNNLKTVLGTSSIPTIGVKQDIVLGNVITPVKEYLDRLYEFRLNTVNYQLSYRTANSNSEFVALEDNKRNTIFINTLQNGHKISKSVFNDLIESEEIATTYNPIRDYFLNLPLYDGVTDYFKILADNCFTFSDDPEINEKEKDRFTRMLKKHFRRMVKQVFENSKYFNKQMFVLQSSIQSVGKTSFLRWLMPNKMGMHYLKENPKFDKDGRIGLATSFIGIFDEFASFSKSTLEELKAFMTNSNVNERLPFGRSSVSLKRYCSFFGTTNENDFLKDHTGNDRFIVFSLSKAINFNFYETKMNVDDLYAQAYWEYKQGFETELDKNDRAENDENNLYYAPSNDYTYLINTYLIHGRVGLPKHQYYSASELVKFFKEKEPNININSNSLGKALHALGHKPVSIRIPEQTPMKKYCVVILEGNEKRVFEFLRMYNSSHVKTELELLSHFNMNQKKEDELNLIAFREVIKNLCLMFPYLFQYENYDLKFLKNP